MTDRPPVDAPTEIPTAELDDTALERPEDYRPVGRFAVDTTAAAAPDIDDEQTIALAGRVVLWRDMGGLAFGQIQDQTGRVQVSLQKKELGAEQYKAWAKAIKSGDFIGVRGHMWTTNKGERRKIYDTVQKTLACQGPIAFLANGDLFTAMRSNVKDFVPISTRSLVYLRQTTLSK